MYKTFISITSLYRVSQLLVLLLILSTCTKEEDKDRLYPRIRTLDIVDVSETGATFQAEVFYSTNEQIIEHGFVWGTLPNASTFNDHDKKFLGPFQGTGRYSARVNTTLVQGQLYYVKPFIKTQTYTVYGEEASFKSLGCEAPIITDFEPKREVTWGDTITIKGKNFSWLYYYNKVYFNQTMARYVAGTNPSNDSVLKVIVPDELVAPKANISIQLAGKTFTYTQDTLKLFFPDSIWYTPLIASWDEAVYIKGFFPQSAGVTYSVKFNNVAANIIGLSNQEIRVRVPQNLLSTQAIISVFNGYTTQTAKVPFNLKPPQIISFSPVNAWAGATITINGKYFKAAQTRVFLNNIEVTSTLNVTSTSISFVLPTLPSQGEYTVKVTVLEQEVVALGKLNYVNPMFSNVSPYNLTFNDTVALAGNFACDNLSSIGVKFNSVSAEIVSVSNSQIKVIVPANLTSGRTVYINGPWGQLTKTFAYEVIKPIVQSFSALQGGLGDIIHIYGNYFNPQPNLQTINIGEIISATRNHLEVKLGYLSSGNLNVYLYNPALGSVLLTNSFNGISPFTKLSNFPFLNLVSLYGRLYGEYNGFGYFGSGNSIFQYNPDSDSWAVRKTLPNYLHYPIFFNIQDKIFYINRYSLVLNEYNISSNEVSQKANFPGVTRNDAFCFSIGSKAYLGGGYSTNTFLHYSDMWEYNSITNEWVQLSDIPSGDFKAAATFVIDNKAYLVENNNLWCFDPSTSIWIKKANYPGGQRYFATGFTLNNLGYVLHGKIGYYSGTSYASNELWQYNPLVDQWQRKYNYPGSNMKSNTSIVVDGKAYLGFGFKSDVDGLFINELYRYDPSLDNN